LAAFGYRGFHGASFAGLGSMDGAYILQKSYSIRHTVPIPSPLRPHRQGLPAPSHRSFRPMSDSFATRARLDVNGKSYTYASLPKLGEKFDIARLPYSMKILRENLLRHEDGGMTVGKEHIEAVAKWDPKA